MPKVKATKAFKIQLLCQDFPENCRMQFLWQYGFLQQTLFVKGHRNTSKYQKALGSRPELLIPHTSQMFSKSSITNFVEKVTKAFCLLIFLCTS